MKIAISFITHYCLIIIGCSLVATSVGLFIFSLLDRRKKRLASTPVDSFGLPAIKGPPPPMPKCKPPRRFKVFLGGTCNESKWRDELIPMLKCDYYNPVVDDWTPDCVREELLQRKECDLCLYVVTPRMTGTYSIAEAVDDSNKRPEETVFVVIEEDGGLCFTEGQLRSLRCVSDMIRRNKSQVFRSLKESSSYINLFSKE